MKVGLLVGCEGSFPSAFLEEVNRRNDGVVAEYVKLGGTRMNEPCPYTVLLDRISHRVPYYRSYLEHAVLMGVTVVNNPFLWTAHDKFFEAALAAQLGVAHPKTLVLPNKEYAPDIDHPDSLRNLIYPLDWRGIVDYVGLPCVLKDASGGNWQDVTVCRSLDDLIHHYNQTGLRTMIVQEFIVWDHDVRCLCLGQDEVLTMKYDPHQRRYHVEGHHLGKDLERRVVEDSLKLVRALGYDINTVEWAIRKDVPYAIDYLNPAPELDIDSLTPVYFDWAVKHLASLAIRLAKNPGSQRPPTHWQPVIGGTKKKTSGVETTPDVS